MPERSGPLRIELASPCAQKWDAMQGDLRKRFCAGCRKNVYDLSGLSRAEVQELIARHEGRLCVRFFERADGTLLTSDCPVGLAAKAAKAARWAQARLALAVATCIGVVLGGGALLDREPLGPQPDAPVVRRPRPWYAPPLPIEALPPPVTHVVGAPHPFVENAAQLARLRQPRIGILKGVRESEPHER